METNKTIRGTGDKDFTWSEIFSSFQAEGTYTGWPAVFVRFARCNFTCSRFNNPDNVKITNTVLGFDPHTVTSLNDLPPITMGCDSLYSWDSRFSHLWKSGSASQLAQEINIVVPHNRWQHPTTHQSTILIFTGGESTLYAKRIPTLLEQYQFNTLHYVLFETNCSVPLQDSFIVALNKWCSSFPIERKVIWSNSPKLSISGEAWNKAIRPEIAVKQRMVDNSEQYFKFVTSYSDADFDEVEQAMQAYYKQGIPTDVPVYIMPVSCVDEQQINIAEKVARKCIERGYIYCHRVQLSVFKDQIGT